MTDRKRMENGEGKSNRRMWPGVEMPRSAIADTPGQVSEGDGR